MTEKQRIPKIRVAAVFCCHDGRGNVLLAQRGPKARNGHGQWDIGGGEVEYGEPLSQAARREIREEYGVDVEESRLVPLGFREVFQFEGEGCHWIAFDFVAHVDPARVSNPEGVEKFSGMRWFPFGQWPAPLYSKLPEFLEKNDARLREICRPRTDAPPVSSWPDDPGLVNAIASLPPSQWADAMRQAPVVAASRVVLPPPARPRPEDYGRPATLPSPPLPSWWFATDAWLRAYARAWKEWDTLCFQFSERWVLMDANGVLGDFATHTDGYRFVFEHGLDLVDAVLFRPDELK
jgi:8-oxo-dGTP pyrophosphatase MutT (NUDIX family)